MNKFLLAVALLMCTVVSRNFAQLMPIPPHSSVWSNFVRGYYFTAPTNFTITGLKVSPEAGTGVQYIHVIKINDPVPVVFAATSTNFTTLAFISGAPNNVTQPVSITVNSGDIIGIFGSTGPTGQQSYSLAPTPHATTINGFPVNLYRLVSQQLMVAPVTNYTTEAGGSISRVEMTYSVGPPPPPACLLSPVAPVNNSTTVCAGSTMLRWNKAANATGYDVYLNAGTAAPTTIVSTNQPDTFFLATTIPGPYRWRIVPRNAQGMPSGCSNWAFTTIPGLTPAVSITVSPDDTICQGTTAVFTATPVNGGATPSFQWKKNNINVGVNSQFYSDAALVNNDDIRVVMTSNAVGCLSDPTPGSNTINMKVLSAPPANITPMGPLEFCNGGSVTLTTTTVGTNYKWYHNSAEQAGATSPSYVASYDGYYKVSVIAASNKCPLFSDSVKVTVYQTPFPLVNRTGMILSTAAFYDTYQWYYNDIMIPGATTNTHTITRDGRYIVKVKDTSGCDGTSIVTPINSLSITSVSPGDVRIYPNPATNFISIISPVSVNVSLRSITGKLILNKVGVDHLDISTLPSGLYLLYLTDESNHLIKVEKLNKQ